MKKQKGQKVGLTFQNSQKISKVMRNPICNVPLFRERYAQFIYVTKQNVRCKNFGISISERNGPSRCVNFQIES